MKSLKSLLLIIPVLLFSCGETDDLNNPKGEHGVYITGVKKGLSYEFTSPNGRVVSSDDEVTSLAVFILSENGQIAYEQHYYPYYENQVPDTIFIPNLPAGQYELMATTVDYYNYWWGYIDDRNWEESDAIWAENPNGEIDSTDMLVEMLLPYNSTSSGPIYVGYEAFKISDDEVLVDINMKNVSAKITFNMESDYDFVESGLEMRLRSSEAMSFDFRTSEFIPVDYESYIYNWLDGYTVTRNLYIMPQTLKSMDVRLYQWYSGLDVEQTYDFDQPISLKSGDAITFTLDMEEFLNGAGSGSINFEDINWNDLGEVNIP